MNVCECLFVCNVYPEPPYIDLIMKSPPLSLYFPNATPAHMATWKKVTMVVLMDFCFSVVVVGSEANDKIFLKFPNKILGLMLWNISMNKKAWNAEKEDEFNWLGILRIVSHNCNHLLMATGNVKSDPNKTLTSPSEFLRIFQKKMVENDVMFGRTDLFIYCDPCANLMYGQINYPPNSSYLNVLLYMENYENVWVLYQIHNSPLNNMGTQTDHKYLLYGVSMFTIGLTKSFLPFTTIEWWIMKKCFLTILNSYDFKNIKIPNFGQYWHKKLYGLVSNTN